jgi:hypothetical protein
MPFIKQSGGITRALTEQTKALTGTHAVGGRKCTRGLEAACDIAQGSRIVCCVGGGKFEQVSLV